MKKTLLLKTMLLLWALIVGSLSVWADETLTIGFEEASYTNWTLDNITPRRTNSGVPPHSGTYYGNTSSNSSASVKTTEKIANPKSITFYVSKESTNTNAGSVWKIKVSSDGTNWSQVGDNQSAASEITKGTWTEVTRDLSGYNDVYVGVFYDGTSALRCIDDVSIVYSTGGGDIPTLKDCDLALTGAPITLNFDLYNNSSAQVINYTTSGTGTVTIDDSDYAEFDIDEENKTITVTPKTVTPSAQTITVNQKADETYNAGSVTFTFTITDSTPKTGAWVLTGLADLTEGDVFVIVGDNGDTYAMSNNNGTSSAPSAVAVTIENNEITSDVDDNIKWTISGNAENGYTFYPNGDTNSWLYCNTTASSSSNNNMRVGTGDRKVFYFTGYLVTKDNYTARYLSIYNDTDWRGYVNTNSAPSISFYKYSAAVTVKNPVITVDETFTGSTTATITCATQDATIYYSFDNTSWTEYTEALTITETTTIYAKAVKDEDESAVVSKTTTRVLPKPTVTIDATGITNTNVFEGTMAGSLTASVTYNDAAVEGAVVTWSENNSSVATIDKNTGAVTLVAAGTVTFTATYAGNSDYSGNTETYEMTVTNDDPNAPGTENNPYKVSEITTTENGVYVQGIISSITEVSTSYNNATYKISEDGTKTNEFTVYRGRYLDNADFTSEDQISVGDSVVIYGNIGTYQEQLQLNQNNYLVKLIRKAATPSITVAEFAIDAPAEGKDGTITVTYNNITDVVSEVFFCDAEGNAADYDWVVAEINNSHNLDYVISENTTESARTAYLKVHALDDEANDVYSELITISQAKPVVMNTYTLATSVVPGRHYLIVGNYQSYKKALASQNTNNRRTVDITLNDATASVESEAGAREILISVDENTGYFTLYDEVEEGYLYAACGAGTGNYLKTEKSIDDDGYGLWTISFDEGKAIIKATNGGRNWLRYNSGSDVFSCYASGQKDVYLYERDGDTGSQTVDVNIASACTDNEGYYYGTFSAPYSFIAPADITVSEIGIDEAGKLDVQAYCIEDVVPANTGVMISSTTSGSHTLTVVAGKGTSVMGNGNRLRATGNEGITATAMNEADPDCVFYRLTMHNKTNLGFYWGAADGVAFDVVANKAYLAVPKSAGARIQGFSFEDGVITGIRNITPALSEGEGAIFDLQGRRVAKPVNGLYIVNGKKIVIK